MWGGGDRKSRESGRRVENNLQNSSDCFVQGVAPQTRSLTDSNFSMFCNTTVMVHTDVSEDCKRKNNQLYYGLLRSGGCKDLVLILND